MEVTNRLLEITDEVTSFKFSSILGIFLQLKLRVFISSVSRNFFDDSVSCELEVIDCTDFKEVTGAFAVIDDGCCSILLLIAPFSLSSFKVLTLERAEAIISSCVFCSIFGVDCSTTLSCITS